MSGNRVKTLMAFKTLNNQLCIISKRICTANLIRRYGKEHINNSDVMNEWQNYILYSIPNSKINANKRKSLNSHVKRL